MSNTSRSKLVHALAFLFLLAASPLDAVLCGLDDRPGATLLLPYFEVDLDDPAGVTTVFTVHNTSADPLLARVVLWTDAAYPTAGFDVELTGYDLQPINLRDVFTGRFPDPEAPIPGSCDTGSPLPNPSFLRGAHTGQATPQLEGLCAGFDHDDDVARGYVTVDVVTTCSELVPSDAGYFGGDGVAGYANVLWGDFFYYTSATGRTEGDVLVSLEADAGAFGPGDLTFYSRYVEASGADGREPLPTLWSNRYLNGGPLNISSSSIVWRDTGAMPEAFDCPSQPDWYPLDFNEIVSLDEQGNAVFRSEIVFIAPPEPIFPAATQQGIGFRNFAFGAEMLDLNPAPDQRLQSFVMEVVEADRGASYMRTATPLDAGCSVAGCTYGTVPDVGRVCLTGSGDAEESGLEPGAAIRVRVEPRGCFSSGCTRVYRSLCRVRGDAAGLEAQAGFCLRQEKDPDVFCTADCGGGGFAECSWAEGLPEGDYTLRLEGLELAFSIPMELPDGELCAEVDDLSMP